MIDVGKVAALLDYLKNILSAQQVVMSKEFDKEEKLEKLRKKLAKSEKKLLRSRERAVKELLREERGEERDKSKAGEIIKHELHEELGDEKTLVDAERAEMDFETDLLDDTKKELEYDLHIRKDIEMQLSLIEQMGQMIKRDDFNSDVGTLNKFADACEKYNQLLEDKMNYFAKKRETDYEMYDLMKREQKMQDRELKAEHEVENEVGKFAGGLAA